MPQLTQLSLALPSQWFWLLLVLGTLYFFVGRGIVPKVEATVDERDGKIAADLAEADRLRDAADVAEEEWRAQVNTAHARAQAVVAEARAKAAADGQKRVAAADKRLAKKADEAAVALGAARDSALAEIEQIAAEAAGEIVSRLASVKVTEADARKAVAGALTDA